MMKFADSLYKCKMLKRAVGFRLWLVRSAEALGRMSTSVKKLQGALNFLEEARESFEMLVSLPYL